MKNDDLQAARHYHEGTKHPNGDLLRRNHRYTPEDRPFLYKVYEELEPIPLPLDKPPGAVPALEAIAAVAQDGRQGTPDLETVTRLLYFSAGITKRIDYGPPVGEIAFRAASCTGALYHIELYLVCGDLPDLAAGVYHFDPRQNALRRLREGDYRSHLAKATADEAAVAAAPLTIVYSDVFWRNAVKYQAREYRHAFWDSGVILAHTLAMSAAHGLPARLVMGFVDEQVNHLLDLNEEWEAALALLPVGETTLPVSGATPEAEPLSLKTKPIMENGRGRAKQILQPVLEMHAASTLTRPEQVKQWRNAELYISLPEPSDQRFPLEPFSEAEMAGDPLEEVIQRRGSSRRFRREAITFPQLSTILQQSTRDVTADFAEPSVTSAVAGLPTEPPADLAESSGLNLNHLYLIVNAVEGLPAGAYVYHREREALELLQATESRREAGYLALGQALGRDASVNLYFLTDLEPVLQQFGNRGYRAAQLEASVAAGRIYLAAYAQGLGATGLTFYDNAVTDFFSPHAAGKSVTFLITVGRPAPRR